MKQALFIIDVQNFFINPLTASLPGKIRRYIQKNRRKFDIIIFTHFVNTPTSSVYRLLGWKKSMTATETRIAQDLQPLLSEGILVSKHVYSALKAPGIHTLLKSRGVQKIYLCGIDTDSCVLATAYDAFDRGYDISLLKNLCMSSSHKSLHTAALSLLKRNVGV
jgi:nicotinamidase-related amidase